MDSLELVSLTRSMERTNGRPEVIVGLVDGPVWLKDAALWSANVRHLGTRPGRCVIAVVAAGNQGFLGGGRHRVSLPPAVSRSRLTTPEAKAGLVG